MVLHEFENKSRTIIFFKELRPLEILAVWKVALLALLFYQFWQDIYKIYIKGS